MSDPIIILGSARSQGGTWKAVQGIVGAHPHIPIIDLNDFNLSPFDYQHRNQDDDYLSLMERVLEHDLIVLATPVYWYTMSAQMKIFIDRLSDLLEIAKEVGRKLRGKHLFVIASFHTSKPKGFEYPFWQTCEYMRIKYEGCSFICQGRDLDILKDNAAEIEKARKIMGLK